MPTLRGDRFKISSARKSLRVVFASTNARMMRKFVTKLINEVALLWHPH